MPRAGLCPGCRGRSRGDPPGGCAGSERTPSPPVLPRAVVMSPPPKNQISAGCSFCVPAFAGEALAMDHPLPFLGTPSPPKDLKQLHPELV